MFEELIMAEALGEIMNVMLETSGTVSYQLPGLEEPLFAL